MTFIPKIIKPPKSAMRKERSVPHFRRWIKRHQCSVKGCQEFPCDPAHIRVDLPLHAQRGGTGLKPHDSWIIPLCRPHHNEQGDDGERTFYDKYKIDSVTVAETLWQEWLNTTDQGRKYALAYLQLSHGTAQR